MSRGFAMIIAIAGNIAVMCVSWAVRGWSLVGAHFAARNTARYSALWLMVTLASPGLARWISGLPAQAALIQSFVAAHMVHFASVIVVLAFEPARVSRNLGPAVVAIAGGFALVLALGLTAKPRPSWVYAYLYPSLLYGIFFIFLGGLLDDRFHPFRAAGGLLILALFLRLMEKAIFGRVQSANSQEGVSQH